MWIRDGTIAVCKVEDHYDTGETQAQKSDAQLRDDYLKKTFNGVITITDQQANSVAGIMVEFAGQQYQTNASGQINYSGITTGNHR